jgi:hypothetical protein
MTHDPDLRHVNVTTPEFSVRIHSLNAIENKPYIGDQDILGKLADRDPLRSSISVHRPIGLKRDLMSIREHRD